MGVRRAMEMVLAAANREKGPLYTYGPLIHNVQVLELLESKNVRVLKDIHDVKTGTVIIRAHGIPPQERKILKASHLNIIDATCPRVGKLQSIIRYHTHKGYIPVIVGDRDHSEVIGLMGYSDGKAIVINELPDLSILPETGKILLVAQTTQNKEKFLDIIDAVKSRFPEALVFNTICEATIERQEEVRSLADHVDAMVVVGGYHSGNTRRLVQVSEAAGSPTFHIETEKELDKYRLSAMEVIGVTAGASTPNWMIKNVVREIEGIHGRGETAIERWSKKTLKFLLLSNLLVAMGAFSLSYAAAVLSGRNPGIIYPLLAFLYIYAMHVLNRFLDKGASTYNDPERANFHRKHKLFLILSGITAIAGALALSFYLRIGVFLAITGLILLGIVYSITIVPVKLRSLWRYSKIKDIPGSKTLSEAFAWAVVITLLPLLEKPDMPWPGVLISFYVILSIAFVRSAFFDIFQVQGDLIVGVETLPITLGEKKTFILLKLIIISVALVLIIASLTNLVSHFAILLLLCSLTLALSLAVYENRLIYPGPLFEYLVEGNLFLAGILGLLWQTIQ